MTQNFKRQLQIDRYINYPLLFSFFTWKKIKSNTRRKTITGQRTKIEDQQLIFSKKILTFLGH